MKHLSADWWKLATAAADLRSEGDLQALLRARLDAAGSKPQLASELGLTAFQLTGFLRGRWPIGDDLAAKLGYRKVVRYERVS